MQKTLVEMAPVRKRLVRKRLVRKWLVRKWLVRKMLVRKALMRKALMRKALRIQIIRLFLRHRVAGQIRMALVGTSLVGMALTAQHVEFVGELHLVWWGARTMSLNLRGALHLHFIYNYNAPLKCIFYRWESNANNISRIV